MNYKNKLIELLKTIPEIKDDLEELKFWTILKILDTNEYDYWIETPNWEEYILLNDNNFIFWMELLNLEEGNFEIKIIWNPIHRHHLEWFCEENKIFLSLVWGNLIFNYMFKELRIKLNNKKSLDEQTEEVYEKIYNFLKNNLT